MIGTIIGNLHKSSASLILENLLNLQKTSLGIQFDAEKLSIDLVNELWIKEEDFFNWRYINWPNKLSICVASLSYAVMSENHSDNKREVLIASLLVALTEVESRYRHLLDRPIDRHFISPALAVAEKEDDRFSRSSIWQDLGALKNS
ncbi:MAG: hypothetical protein HRU29_02500 [Rhizobiales bacterium]|nr:hypothetical protein [Hyphomicrobiales bacterium]NRB13249.1 hypothetical protein [Hyphomicrobiales bacterium]